MKQMEKEKIYRDDVLEELRAASCVVAYKLPRTTDPEEIDGLVDNIVNQVVAWARDTVAHVPAAGDTIFRPRT